jgi:dienelactone hydrolase
LAAVDDGAPIDELIAWAVPSTGRRYVRGLRAFAGTQASRVAGDPVRDHDPPDGWLVVNGFALHPDTVASLSALDARGLRTGTLKRALIIAQDGMDDGDSLASHLERCDVIVTRSRAKGYADLVEHPERSVLSAAVLADMDHWLARSPVHSPPELPTLAAPRSSQCQLDEAAGPILEHAVAFGTPDGELLAIAAQPLDSPAAAEVAIVFLNAGAVRRIGPNRLWVTAARSWASRGTPSLRVDLGGIGDGFGPNSCPAGVDDLYEASRMTQVLGAIDLAVQLWSPRQVVLVGLCSGGYWAFRGATMDPRVRGAVLLNAGALEWHADTSARHQADRLRKVADPAEWRRLLRGETRWRAVRPALEGLVRVLRTTSSRLSRRVVGASPLPDSAEDAFDLLATRGTHVVLAFSSDEVLERELRRTGLFDRAQHSPYVEFRRLPGDDHTLRPMSAQRAVLDLLDDFVRQRRAATGAATERA